MKKQQEFFVVTTISREDINKAIDGDTADMLTDKEMRLFADKMASISIDDDYWDNIRETVDSEYPYLYNLCGKPHNNGEETCGECIAIRLNI